MLFNELYQNGVKSFEAKDFSKATDYFTQALDLQPKNTTVLVNLALSEFKSGQKSASYSYFKKALHIDPHFVTAQQGLDFVKSQFQMREIPHRIEYYERWRESFIKPFSVVFPLILTLMVFTIWGFRTLKYFGNRKKAYFAGEDPDSYGLFNLVLRVFLVIGIFWSASFKYDSSLQRGLVKSDSVPVRSAPIANGPEILQIYGGLEIHILREKDGWLQIEYPGTIAGWVPMDSILRL